MNPNPLSRKIFLIVPNMPLSPFAAGASASGQPHLPAPNAPSGAPIAMAAGARGRLDEHVVVHMNHRDLEADQVFDRLETHDVILAREREGLARCARARGAA